MSANFEHNADRPAAPIDGTHLDGGYSSEYGGLTTREYFAAKAMQGLLSSTVFESRFWRSGGFDHYDFASEAVAIADAVLVLLGKEPPE